MSKMHLPELAIIRFSTEDVIATSANGKLGANLISNKWYVTIGSELKEDPNVSKSTIKDSTRYWFQYIGNTAKNIDSSSDQIDTEGATYAWFHNNQWRTGDDLKYYFATTDLQFLTTFTEYYTN